MSFQAKGQALASPSWRDLWTYKREIHLALHKPGHSRDNKILLSGHCLFGLDCLSAGMAIKTNKISANPFVKMGLTAFAVLAFAALTAMPISAAPPLQFQMVRSPGLTNFPSCVPHARGFVSITSNGPVEVLSLFVTGLPPNTNFDFFVIQAPNPPFGLSWYQGDIDTNSIGQGAGFFVGRFNIETFIVAPGITSAPLIFRGPNPSVGQNPKTGPVQLYHLGLWFNSPADAAKAGGPNTVTPFNGEHDAGVQVLSTSQFVTIGPLAAAP
jgi:hypothetical protein